MPRRESQENTPILEDQRLGTLTPRQMQVIIFIRDYYRKLGYFPTLQEIGEKLSISKVTVLQHLRSLQRKGVIQRHRYQARSMQISSEVNFPLPGLTFPLVGLIAAGRPVEAIETPDQLDLEQFFQQRKGTYVLKVQGDSMIEEQIRDGDYVIVQPGGTARNGQTVVALLPNGEATLKKFYREKGRIRLQPANPDLKPIYTKKLQIQGVVIGILRKY